MGDELICDVLLVPASDAMSRINKTKQGAKQCQK